MSDIEMDNVDDPNTLAKTLQQKEKTKTKTKTKRQVVVEIPPCQNVRLSVKQVLQESPLPVKTLMKQTKISD